VSDSTAEWIWRDDDTVAPRNVFTWFRAEFVGDGILAEEALVAADSNAHVWLNGLPVLRGVTRFTPSRIRADRLTLDSALRPGRNVLLVLHHSWGDITTFQRTGAVAAGLWFEGRQVQSGTVWEWKEAGEFDAEQSQFLGLDGSPRIRYPIVRQVGDGLTIEAVAASTDGWRSVRIVDGPWPRSPEPVETSPRRSQDERPFALLGSPQVAGGGEAVGSGVHARDAGGEVAFTVSFDRPVHGYPFIALSSTARVSARFEYAEISENPYDGRPLVHEDGRLDPGGVVSADYADMLRVEPSGRHRWEIPEERTLRWLRVTFSFETAGEIDVRDLGVVSTQTDVDLQGSFDAGDADIASFVTLALIHARVTMTDTYVDTPGREDGQWVEDARLRADLTARWFGNTAMRRLAIRLIADGQDLTGHVHPFFPSNFPWTQAPWDWSAPWIGMIADEFLWSGDVGWLRGLWPSVEAYWARAEQLIDADGRWTSTNLLGDVRVSSPLSESESAGIFVPTLIEILDRSAALADAVGERGTADRWRSLAVRVASSLQRDFLRDDADGVRVVEAFDRATGSSRGVLQAAQARPALDGLLPAEVARRLLDEHFPAPHGSAPTGTRDWNTPTWGYYILRALTEHGRGDRAVAHLLDRFAPYLPRHPRNRTPLALQGPAGGPLPEYIVTRADRDLAPGELLDTQPIDATGSHGWAAVPLVWMHDTLLGVRIVEPGGALLHIEPRSAGLRTIAGTTCTPNGAVRVELHAHEPRLVLTIPDGVLADVVLPAEFAGSAVDGEGRPVSERQYLSAGTHTITTRS